MKKLFSGFTDEFWKDYHKKWSDLFEEVKENLHTKPEGEIGARLAKKWMNLVNEVYPEKHKLRKKLWDGYKAGVIPENQLAYDKSIVTYITKACEKLGLS